MVTVTVTGEMMETVLVFLMCVLYGASAAWGLKGKYLATGVVTFVLLINALVYVAGWQCSNSH